MQSKEEVFVKMVISGWDTYNNRVDKLLNKLTEQQLLGETAPGRNSGIYLIGHLIAVSDGLFPILGWGERLFPHLEDVFLKKPDKSGLEKPSLEELKKCWVMVNKQVKENIDKMQPADWFEKHAAVSAEDFEKEPYRNKLNVIITRTGHTSYHLGQLVFLESK
jgi:hypothetical protein